MQQECNELFRAIAARVRGKPSKLQMLRLPTRHEPTSLLSHESIFTRKWTTLKAQWQLASPRHETRDIIAMSETHRLTKKAWSYIKSQRRDNIGIPPLLNEKGELCEDAEDKAEILSRQYTSVFTQDNPLEPVPDVPYSLPSMPDINIEENGILKLLKEVNVYKAIGPDLIPNRILKDCCVELAPILTQIYKKSLREGRLPEEWLSANVTAIFKKGARHEASNYRPISLTSVTCKIFEHVLFSQIMRHYTRP